MEISNNLKKNMSKLVKNTHSCILCGFNSQEECSSICFPKKREKKEKWLAQCKLPTSTDVSSARLCSKHFRPEDFKQVTKRRRLNGDAIPTIFFEVNEALSKQESTSGLSGPYKRRCIICKVCTTEATARFPQKEVDRVKWMQHFQIDPQTNVKHAYICTKHFRHEFVARHRRSSKIIYECEKKDTECNRNEVGTAPSTSIDSSLSLIIQDAAPSTSVDSSLSSIIQGTAPSTSVDNSLSSLIQEAPILIMTNNNEQAIDVEHARDCASSSHGMNDSVLIPTIPATPTGPRSRSRIIFPRYPEEIQTPHIATPRSAKRCVDMTKRFIQKQRVKITLLQQQLRRAKKKIKTFENIVMKLRQDNLLNEDMKGRAMPMTTL